MLELRNEKVAIPVVLLAGILWSFGPLVVRHIDQPELVPWQYLLGRGVTIFLILNLLQINILKIEYKKPNYLNIIICSALFVVSMLSVGKIAIVGV